MADSVGKENTLSRTAGAVPSPGGHPTGASEDLMPRSKISPCPCQTWILFGVMRVIVAGFVVFFGGFAVMVLEIVGARYLAKDFGGSFYVWISQIAVVLVALSLGYSVGGTLADRFRRPVFLTWMLVPTGLLIALIPEFSPPVLDAIILRHPADEAIPMIWQKLDPALGSALIFLLPGIVLAMVSPFAIRLSAGSVDHVGRISGLVYAASTVGSIAGVVVSGYVLVDHFGLTAIFRMTGAMTAVLGILCLGMRGAVEKAGAPVLERKR